jgi:hypothetical protein
MDYSKFEGMTPGPWALSHQIGDGFSVAHEIAPNCGRLLPIITSHIFTAWGRTVDDNEAIANAQAIAALPDLIEENKRLREALEIALKAMSSSNCDSTAEAKVISALKGE